MLVEVMVSMIILIIGFVGITKLQHVTKAANAQSIQRTIASDLADNLVERIRANPLGIGVYFPSDTPLELDGTYTVPTQTCTSTLQCNPNQLATFDLYEWQMQLMGGLDVSSSGASTGGLVDPVVCLLRPAGGGDGIYHIAIAWHGLTRLDNQVIAENANASNCGTGDIGPYDATAGDDNQYRRVHWQEVFLDV